MKIKKYVITGLLILFLSFFTLPVLAASSDFLPQATEFYDRYCAKRRIPNTLAISCYLFDKVHEMQDEVTSLEEKVSELEERIEDLENSPTPTPTPTPTTIEQIVYVISDNTWKFSLTEESGWFNVAFDDSLWASSVAPSGGQCSPSVIGLLINENGALPMSYEASPWSTGYFRKTFNLVGNPTSGSVRVVLDDDGDLYVNGNLALADHDGHVAGIGQVDISPYLVSGANTVALKVIDSAGGCQHAQVELKAELN